MIGLLVIAICGCEQGEYSALEQENASLKRDFEYVTRMVDEVQHNLKQIEEREGLITQLSLELESGSPFDPKDVRGEIMTSLAAIDTYLLENRKNLNELDTKSESSSLQSDDLNNLIEKLHQDVARKDEDISRLRTRVKKLEANLANLQQEIKQKEEVIETKDLTIQAKEDTIQVQEEKLTAQQAAIQAQEAAYEAERMTAYFVVGTRESLTQKGIIDEKKSGLFGLRKKIQVADVEPQFFSPVKKNLNRVQLGPGIKEIELVSAHKDYKDIYTLERENGIASLLLIDPNRFWQVSNYLVVLVKN
jgi:DNA repair exonuclease SbcCD ATPase subunit